MNFVGFDTYFVWRFLRVVRNKISKVLSMSIFAEMKSIIGNSRRADIVFYRNGRIDITSSLAKQLQLQAGDVIDIGCAGKEYYLYVRTKSKDVVGRHRGQCYPSKHNSHNFRTYCKPLCDFFFEGLEYDKLNLATGEPEVTDTNGIAIPIITRQILQQ